VYTVVVKENTDGFTSSLSAYKDTTVDDTITVTLKPPAEGDNDKNFVDGNNAAISGNVTAGCSNAFSKFPKSLFHRKRRRREDVITKERERLYPYQSLAA
jgi:hypothetical protein